MELIIGTKAWSTWSLRAWLVLKRLGVPFTETVIRLRSDDTAAQVLAVSGSGWVPLLRDGEITVWDSLAICEYLAERFPQAGLWPDEIDRRALARSAVAEMHSGFSALRKECPMDLSLRATVELSQAAHKDIARIVGLWGELRGRFGADGPFLFGQWSIADAYFTPVATRLRTYRIDPAGYGDDGSARAYASVLLSTPEFLAWEADARRQVD